MQELRIQEALEAEVDHITMVLTQEQMEEQEEMQMRIMVQVGTI